MYPVSKVWTDLETILLGTFNPETNAEHGEQFKRNIEQFHDIVAAMIKQHIKARYAVNGWSKKSYWKLFPTYLIRAENDYERAPFLDTLLDHYSDDPEYVASQVITFLVGGFHTTGNFLSWVLYYLAKHPECQERVWKEIRYALHIRNRIE